MTSSINYDDAFVSDMLQVIEESITASLGRDVTQVVIYNFKNTTKLEREAIIRNPEVFETSLDNMLWSGSKLVKSLVIREIEGRFGVPIETRGCQKIHEAIRAAWKARRSSLD